MHNFANCKPEFDLSSLLMTIGLAFCTMWKAKNNLPIGLSLTALDSVIDQEAIVHLTRYDMLEAQPEEGREEQDEEDQMKFTVFSKKIDPVPKNFLFVSDDNPEVGLAMKDVQTGRGFEESRQRK